jgi:hypothetical protein
MVGESEWLTLVQLVWGTLLGLVTMTAMALLLMRILSRRGLRNEADSPEGARTLGLLDELDNPDDVQLPTQRLDR